MKCCAADGNRRGVRHRALEEDDQVAGVRADVEQANAQFALVGGERGLGGGDRLEHRLGHFKAGAVGAGDRALQRAAGAGGDVQIHFQPRADHADGIEDAGLLVEDELARQQVQNLAIGRALDGAGALDGGAHIFAGDLAHAVAQLDAAVGVEAANMRAADAHHALVDVGARHALGLLVGGLDGLGGGSQIGDQPLAHARRLDDAVAAIAQRALVQVGGQHARPRAADVEHHDQVVLFLAHRAHCPCLAAAVRVAEAWFAVGVERGVLDWRARFFFAFAALGFRACARALASAVALCCWLL